MSIEEKIINYIVVLAGLRDYDVVYKYLILNSEFKKKLLLLCYKYKDTPEKIKEVIDSKIELFKYLRKTPKDEIVIKSIMDKIISELEEEIKK